VPPPRPPYADDELAPCCMYCGGGGPACMLIAMDRLSCRAWYWATAHHDRVSASRSGLASVQGRFQQAGFVPVQLRLL